MKKSSPDIKINKNSPQISVVLSKIVFDSGLFMAWISEEDAHLTNFNKKWLRFTGRTIKEEMGNGWTYVVHPEDIVRCIYKYKNAFNRRKEFRMKYRLRRYDGIYFWIINHGWPVVDKSNNFLGYIGLCDILSKDKNIDADNKEHLYDRNSKSILINNPDEILDMQDDQHIELNDKVEDRKKGITEKHLHRNSNSYITKREQEIIELIIQGYRNKQIAIELNISSNTVRNHIFNIFSKCNVSNRVQLLNQVFQPKF